MIGLAYANNVAGAEATRLYGIDATLGVLVRVDPENQGVLTTVGPLGAFSGVGDLIGFDISG